jgi:hypothetical protein
MVPRMVSPRGTSQWTESMNSARIQPGKFDERASGTQAHLSTVLHPVLYRPSYHLGPSVAPFESPGE